MLDELRANDPLARSTCTGKPLRCGDAHPSCSAWAHTGRRGDCQGTWYPPGTYWEHLGSTMVMTTVAFDSADDGDVGVQIAQDDVEAADEHLARKEARAALRRAVRIASSAPS